MPNWCYTEITMVGSQENVNRLYNDVTELLAEDRKGSSEDTWSFLNDSNWLGYVAEGLLGVFRDKISFRGTLDSIEDPWKESGDKWRVDMMWCTAWSPCYELQKLLAQRYKLRLYFRAEEGGCGLYETNDACGEYFCRYRLDECEYSTYEELVADCRKEYGCEIRDFDHLRRIIEETGQSLQCYELVDDYGDKIENRIKVGARVRWNDPAICDYPAKQRKAVLAREFEVCSIDGEIILISEVGGGTEAQVFEDELEPYVKPAK